MIKRINKIKNFAVFSNYNRNTDLRDFNDKNIIYGWNYSGKTTISRLISYLDKETVIDDDYKNLEFEIELSDGSKITNINRSNSPVFVKVFNSDFVKNNLHFDSSIEEQKITGIKFAIGDIGDIHDEIKRIENYIQKARKIKENISKPINDFNALKNSFTNIAKSLTDVLNLGRNFTKTHVNTYVERWENQDFDTFIISDENELAKIRINATSQNTGSIIDTNSSVSSNFLNLEKIVREILEKQPKQSSDDELLSSDNDLYNWARSGLNIYTSKRTDLTKCAFCGGDLSTKRLQKLNAFYSNEAAKLKSEIEKIKEEINVEISRFENLDWSKKSENDLATSIKSAYTEKKQEYTSILNEYKNILKVLMDKLDEKLEKSLFLSIELGELDYSANKKIIDWINSVKEIFSQSNNTINEFEKTQKEAKEKYKQHYIADWLVQNNYKYKELRMKVINKRLKKIDDKISQKENEVNELRNQLDSIDKGKEELNLFINKFLNREDLIIEVTEDKYFILKRNGKVATHLSEGEKSAIAFSHFMVVLKSLKDEGKLNDYIIFIDDPISSLDANHIAQVYSFINTFFFQKSLNEDNHEEVCNCFRQLFISTHNFEFFSFLKDSNYLNKKKKVQEGEKKVSKPTCNYYLIKKVDKTTSTIENIPKSLSVYKSEYIYLFSEIEKFKNENYPEDRAYMMPNIVRRFLEIYTLMKLPGNTDQIDNRIKILFEDNFQELKILHTFSHFTSFDRVAKHSELIIRIKDVVDDLYKILETDKEHFESLQEGIKQ